MLNRVLYNNTSLTRLEQNSHRCTALVKNKLVSDGLISKVTYGNLIEADHFRRLRVVLLALVVDFKSSF